MTGWIIAGAAVLLFVLLLTVRLRLFFEYDGELRLSAGVLFLRFRILPEKTRRIKLSDFKIKNFRRRRLKEIKTARREQKKALADAKKKADINADKQTGDKKSTGIDIHDLLSLLRDVVMYALRRFAGCLRIEIHRLNITVGTDDPAKTAVVYGAAAQGVSALLELMKGALDVRMKRGETVSVNPDFSVTATSAEISIVFSARVGCLLALAIGTFFRYIGRDSGGKFSGKRNKEKNVNIKTSQQRKAGNQTYGRKQPTQ